MRQRAASLCRCIFSQCHQQSQVRLRPNLWRHNKLHHERACGNWCPPKAAEMPGFSAPLRPNSLSSRHLQLAQAGAGRKSLLIRNFHHKLAVIC